MNVSKRLMGKKIKAKTTSKLWRFLRDPVTWYGINYAGRRATQWDFRNKGKSGWTGTSFFVLQCMSDRPVANVKMIPLKFYGWLRKHDQQLQIRDNL